MTLEVVSLPLGAYQTNCYVVTAQGSADAVVIDPGDEAGRCTRCWPSAASTLVAILVTHGHLDHIGAVRDLAAATGVEVWMARGDADDLRSFEPAPVRPGAPGGRRRHGRASRASTSARSMCPATRPAPSPSPRDGVAFVGDVLFAGSIGRTDLDGGDLDTLIASIALLMRELPPRHRGRVRPRPGHHARARARDEPVPRASCGERALPAAARHPGLVRRGRRRSAAVIDLARSVFEPAGYGEVVTPGFEDTELFARSSGETSDVVSKEMYTFEDRSGRLADAAPREHGAGDARLPRRHVPAAAAGQALVLPEPLPLQRRAARPRPRALPVRGRGDRLAGRGGRRRGDRAAAPLVPAAAACRSCGWS